MRKTPIETTEFLNLKRIAKSVEPKIIPSNLANIFLEKDSWDEGYIMLYIEGKKRRVNVAPSFFADLSKMLNVTAGLRKSLSEDEKDNNQFYSEFLDKLKDVQNAVNADRSLTLLYDVVDKHISNVQKGSFGKLSNEAIFDFAEGLVNKYPELSIIDVFASETSPNVSIKLLSEQTHDFSKVMDAKEAEEFMFGLTIGNTGVRTAVGDFAYRLICTNGMMGLRTDERFALPNTERDGLAKLFGHFEAMREQNFLPADFSDNIADANSIHASLAELESVYKMVGRQLIFEYPEQENTIRQALMENYFPDLNAVYQRVKAKGFNPEKLETEEKSFIRTGTTMWDLINTLTDLGSNDHGIFKFQGKNKFQSKGGSLLTSNWDLKNEKWLLL